MSGEGIICFLGRVWGRGTSIYSYSSLFISHIYSGVKFFSEKSLPFSEFESIFYSWYSNGRFFLDADEFIAVNFNSFCLQFLPLRFIFGEENSFSFSSLFSKSSLLSSLVLLTSYFFNFCSLFLIAFPVCFYGVSPSSSTSHSAGAPYFSKRCFSFFFCFYNFFFNAFFACLSNLSF
jgi:hypothetical protein